MKTPENYRYTKSHEWIALNGKNAKVGLTDYAQHALGDIVFINLPEVGADVKAGQAFSDVESVKAVSEAFSPVSGKVIAVNSALEDSPELINSDPYGTWIVEVAFTKTADTLSAAEYDALDKE